MSTQLPSRVPLVTSWLLTNLPAALSLDATQVVDGPPTEANLKATCVIIGDVDHEEDWAALGARNRNETASFTCLIYVMLPGGTQTAAVAAAYGLHSTLDLYLRDNISAIATAAPGVWDVSTRRLSLAKSYADNARLAYLRFSIRLQSRI